MGLHETLSGPATQKLLQRACYDFGETKFERLAQLSGWDPKERSVSGMPNGV
jgi:hypothetical protein